MATAVYSAGTLVEVPALELKAKPTTLFLKDIYLILLKIRPIKEAVRRGDTLTSCSCPHWLCSDVGWLAS